MEPQSRSSTDTHPEVVVVVVVVVVAAAAVAACGDAGPSAAGSPPLATRLCPSECRSLASTAKNLQGHVKNRFAQITQHNTAHTPRSI